MKTVTVGELRQNPTPMLADVAAGETYRITKHGRDVGHIIPPAEELRLIPAPHKGGMRLRDRPTHALRSAASIDALLDDERGSW